MFERFTDRARQVVVNAQDEARRLGHGAIGLEHIFLGTLRDERVASFLETTAIDLERARTAVREALGRGDGTPAGSIPFTPPAKGALESALREALTIGHREVDAEHILLGVLRRSDDLAIGLLAELDADAAREALFRGSRRARFAPGFEVRTLEGPSAEWPRQLAEWRFQGWRVISIVEEDGAYRAVLERRFA